MNDKDFDDLIASIKEAGEIKRGAKNPSRETVIEPPVAPDVAAIRTKLGLTQRQLALFMKVNQRTLQNWEQKRRRPDGPAQVLLSMVSKHPKLVFEALHG